MKNNLWHSTRDFGWDRELFILFKFAQCLPATKHVGQWIKFCVFFWRHWLHKSEEGVPNFYNIVILRLKMYLEIVLIDVTKRNLLNVSLSLWFITVVMYRIYDRKGASMESFTPIRLQILPP